MQKNIALYLEKNEYMNSLFPEVDPMTFYRDVFPVGSFEKDAEEDGKGNGLLTILSEKSHHTKIVHDDLKEIERVQGKEFVIMSPVSYFGKARTAANGRYMYGMTFDLDAVEVPEIQTVLKYADNGFLPRPSYIVNSGNGLHLYYLFNEPIPLYHRLHDQYRELKYELTRKIWNKNTSLLEEKQFQGIFQGFRVVGTQSKLGKEYIVRAWKTGSKLDFFDLNSYLIDESKAVSSTEYTSTLSLDAAKEKYPEWYEKRIVQGQPKGKWENNRALYDWWKDKIRRGASLGHRYNCIMILASFAIKCGIPYEALEKDAESLMDLLNCVEGSRDNPFTEEDMRSALKQYKQSYVYYPRSEIEKKSGISVPPSHREKGKRLKQKDHLELARASRDIRQRINGTKWYEHSPHSGRKPKEDIVIEWQREHPEGKPKDCIEETGLSKNTVYKWWKK